MLFNNFYFRIVDFNFYKQINIRMKKLIQLLFCVALATPSYTQTLFKADFEDGTLGGMTIVDADGKTPAANVASFADAWRVTTPDELNASLTSNVVISNSWYSPPGQADDWLITPAFDVVEGAVMTWEARAIDANYPDGYEVRVSTTDTELSSFTDIIFSIAAENIIDENGNSTSRIAPLADYVGQTVHVAFRNNSTDQFLLLLDNIEAKVIPARDVKVEGFSSTRYHVQNQDIPLSMRITNNGGETLTSIDFNWSDGVNEYTDNISGLSLASGQSMEITSPTMFMAADAIAYDITMSATNPNGLEDLNDVDNTTEGVVNGVSFIPTKVVVGEEGTGTWCGWCPRGAVALEYMAENYKDEFIGIAVHNGDPMVVAEYDGNLGITGFPGGKLDRTVDIDPGNFEEGHLVKKLGIEPVQVGLSASGDYDTRKVTIAGDVEFVTKIDDIDFGIAAVIIEDGVTGTGSGYNQANFYSGAFNLVDLSGVDYFDLPDPILAADIVYDHVAREIIGGFNGQSGIIPTNVVAGDKASFDFEYTVPANINIEKLHVAILVVDKASGAILNGGQTVVSLPTATNEIIDETIANVYPNPVSQTAFVDINLEKTSEVTILVSDIMGRIVSFNNLGSVNGKQQRAYDVSNFPNGLYTFKITAGELVTTKKIMVTK